MNTATTDPLADVDTRFVELTSQEYYAAGCRPWDHRPMVGTITCAIGQTPARLPLVTIQNSIGCTGDYRPDELRAIAAKLLAIADDADHYPMGKRSFFRAWRRY